MTTTRSTTYEAMATTSLRLSLVVIFFIFGLSKFTKFEADGLVPIIGNSPLTSWLNIFGTQGASMFVGIAELIFGALLLIGFWRPASTLALAGAAGSVVTFLTTLTFMVTTPDVIAPDGTPALALMGGFLVKDIVLLAASFVLLAQGMEMRRAQREGQDRSARHAGRPVPAAG